MKAKHIESKWATKSHFLRCKKKKYKTAVAKQQPKKKNKKNQVLKNIETNSKLAERERKKKHEENLKKTLIRFSHYVHLI